MSEWNSIPVDFCFEMSNESEATRSQLVLSSTVPEPFDTPTGSCKRRGNARKQPSKPEQGDRPETTEHRKKPEGENPKSPTTWKQRTFTAACVKEYEKDPVQPYCRHTTWGPATPADVHQLGQRSCATGRSVAILSNKELAMERQSERQLSGGNKVELYRPLASTSKPRPPRKTLKRRPACPERREYGPGLDHGGRGGHVPSPS